MDMDAFKAFDFCSLITDRPTRLGMSSLGLALALMSPTAWAQHVTVPVEQVVNLSSSAFVEVPQDWLSLRLQAVRDGADAAVVQQQLKQALDAALALTRPEARPGQIEVRTGAFGLYPRHGRDGRIMGWQGSAELVLEGRDIARLSALAGRVQSMSLAQVAFSLSRDARQRLESEVQAQAIERFKARAQEVSQAFGFNGYRLREISVSSADGASPPMPRLMAMEARASSAMDSAVPVEPGKATVNVTVSGSVQMR